MIRLLSLAFVAASALFVGGCGLYSDDTYRLEGSYNDGYYPDRYYHHPHRGYYHTYFQDGYRRDGYHDWRYRY